MELTSEQAAILATRDRDVVVTAGAGSGKTRVLVEHYVGLLDECSIPEIAAVTFTDAAAAEMRERVRREVLGRADLERHRGDLDRAVIGTIHSLCLEVLRAHPVEAGIDPGAGVLGDDEAEFELLAACADATEAAAEQDGPGAHAIRALGTYHAQLLLPQMVARRNEVRAAFDALPGDGVADWVEHVHAVLDRALEDALAAVRSDATRLIDAAHALVPAGRSDNLTEQIADVRERIHAAVALPSHEAAEGLLAARRLIKRNVGGRSGWAAEAKEYLRELQELLDPLSSVVRWNAHDEEALAALEGMRALFDDACGRYEARKRELLALDYLDLELRSTALLEQHPAIAEAYRRRFRYVMVDECQDTNPLQVRFIRLLAGREGAATGAPPTSPVRLFLVGDAKQAIYRFRGSDVRHFNRLHAEIAGSGGAALSLSRSFRTHDALVDVTNALFAAVLGEPRADFEVPMQAMAGRGAEGPPAPHLVIAPVSNVDSDGDGEGADAERALRVEADLVASSIAALIEEERPVWDRELGAYRPARAGDVALLLRRLTKVHAFEQALEAHAVPYATPAGAGFFSRQEITDLTNLLAWLAEEDDEIALLGVLRSPMFLLDDPTLLELRRERRSLFAALAAPPPEVSDEMRERCRHAREVLGALRARAGSAGTDELLAEALERTGVEATWAALRGGEQSLANIRKFVRLAHTLADRPLDAFVDYIGRRRDDLMAREGQAVVDRPDAVQLMTVHAAKGLEFPIVFVPECDVAPRVTWDALRWRSEDGLSMTLQPDPDAEDRKRQRPGFYDYLRSLEVAEEEAEHRRLFYVAATRAADYLHLSGTVGKNGLGDGWLKAALEAFADAPPANVDVREAVAADTASVERRQPPPEVVPPAVEEPYEPPLLARPRVIPVRRSTPVTALRPPHVSLTGQRFAHGDGLGLLRGNLAHRAIEVAHTSSAAPDLDGLLREAGVTLDADAADRLVAEVAAMLERFEASPLAATLRDPATRAHFELPFAWDWDGVPVHGAIDLAYRADGGWHVVDFKTDDLRGRSVEEAAEPYLAQLGLYGRAIERATGAAPTLSLLFLRTGERYEPPGEAVEAALAAARERVDLGASLDPEAELLPEDLVLAE